MVPLKSDTLMTALCGEDGLVYLSGPIRPTQRVANLRRKAGGDAAPLLPCFFSFCLAALPRMEPCGL